MKSKQVIVLRKDLNMRKGKMVSQGAHASMKVILEHFGIVDQNASPNKVPNKLSIDFFPESPIYDWLNGLFTKVCVSVNSEQELLELYEKAKSMNIPCSLITDAGLTEFNGVPTNTSIAIGPSWEDDVNQITGHLPLL
jgi:PTH2 family peptidyl-tRNA hydrolase